MSPYLHNQAGLVKLRSSGQDRVGVLTVPTSMMRHLQTGMFFRPELTEEGILFRHVEVEEQRETKPPKWTKQPSDKSEG